MVSCSSEQILLDLFVRFSLLTYLTRPFNYIRTFDSLKKKKNQTPDL